MKAIQSLTAVMLLGALSVFAVSDNAIAKSRHHVSDDGSHGTQASNAGQKSAGERGDHADRGGRGDGVPKNSTPGTVNSNAGDRGNQNSAAPISDGPMKNGDSLPGKAGPQNAGTTDPGKNQFGDRGDSSHHDHDAVHPGKTNSTDVGKSDIIADGPGHKTKKPTDTTKKITTIFRPHVIKDHPHASGPGKTERNAIGVVIHNDGNSKSGSDPKVTTKVSTPVLGPGAIPGPTATKTIANAVAPTIGHPGNNAIENTPKNGPIINGTSVGRPGSNLASIGGPTKNTVGTLAGSSFKPRHP